MAAGDGVLPEVWRQVLAPAAWAVAQTTQEQMAPELQFQEARVARVAVLFNLTVLLSHGLPTVLVGVQLADAKTRYADKWSEHDK